ncbi:MAG: 2-deoxy-5-keto-D-gluconate 6-phosphate aldolase domain-containing protein [Bdellovibrionota bacterium]
MESRRHAAPGGLRGPGGSGQKWGSLPGEPDSLGRGEDSRRVREWFKAASRIEAYVGFAVGRTVFWDSLLQLKAGRLARQDAVEQISKNFRALVDLWQGLRLDRPMHGFVSINR